MSFLRQDWPGSKELIVVNDHPLQTLTFDHHQVRIFNLLERFKTLGDKRNFSVEQAKFEHLLIWDDDDIYLPWRISETMRTLPERHFYKCPYAWSWNRGVIAPKPAYNLFHGGSAFSKWLFEKAGRYRSMNGGEDADLERRFQTVTSKKGEFWPHTYLPKDRLYYIYRWNHGSYHATGRTNLSSINPKVKPGTYTLKPHWKSDYIALTRRIARGNV